MQYLEKYFTYNYKQEILTVNSYKHDLCNDLSFSCLTSSNNI